MKVILTQTVPKVGKEGHVVNVADGFARNYLFPRKMAVYADKSQMQVLERRKAKFDARDAETLAEAQTMHDMLHGKGIRLEGKVAGENTRLFGAVTSQDIADALAAQLGVTVDRKQVGLLAPIKQLGKYTIDVDLHRQLETHVSLEVFNPEAEVKAEEEAPVVEEPEEAPVAEAVAETVAEAPVTADES
ncbi:MAG: 50S ribosomal protein L9 [Fimbriimonadaceae bacterium]|nr:50S ribosomal protein L9 [Chthonomonadaceae bacterium]MCO5296862.1 50S ribosomal protein L9 [Fimbriimonadaceae bacterium]